MDWAWFSTPLGLAIIAPTGAFVGALAGVGITAWSTRKSHREKLVADEALAERKVAADLALAEKKLELDRALADWERRTALAEKIFADFYKARDIFVQARSPMAFAGEGATRPRLLGESEDDANQRDAIYAPYERLSREIDFLSELHAKRYRFMALFTQEAAEPFVAFIQTYNQLGIATRALINNHRQLTNEHRQRYEAVIGWTLDDQDPIKAKLDEAVTAIEAICRPILTVRPQ